MLLGTPQTKPNCLILIYARVRTGGPLPDLNRGPERDELIGLIRSLASSAMLSLKGGTSHRAELFILALSLI